MRAIHKKNDTQLTEALAEGDSDAFEELFVRYRRRSHYFVKSKIHSVDAAREIVQEVFADIWAHRYDRKIQDFSPYLFKALKFKTIKFINRLIHQRKYWDHYSSFIPAGINQTQSDINYIFLTDALEEGLSNLPEKTQTIFRLNRLEGKSLAEISKSLKLSEKAAQYHLTKSLKELKAHLKDYIVSVLPALVLLS